MKNSDAVVSISDLQTCTVQSEDWIGLRKTTSIAESLIQIACAQVHKAKALPDDLEKYYIEAMDFSKVNRMQAQIIHQVEAR